MFVYVKPLPVSNFVTFAIISEIILTNRTVGSDKIPGNKKHIFEKLSDCLASHDNVVIHAPAHNIIYIRITLNPKIFVFFM